MAADISDNWIKTTLFLIIKEVFNFLRLIFMAFPTDKHNNIGLNASLSEQSAEESSPASLKDLARRKHDSNKNDVLLNRPKEEQNAVKDHNSVQNRHSSNHKPNDSFKTDWKEVRSKKSAPRRKSKTRSIEQSADTHNDHHNSWDPKYKNADRQQYVCPQL